MSKTVTLRPRQGNPPPRLWEVPAGLMNSIGLPNKGLGGYLTHDLPELARLPVPLIVNVMGFSRDEVAELVSAFGARDEVAALELNVSCPNVKTGMVMGADPGEVGDLLHVVRPLTAKPLIVKLTPERDRRARRGPRRRGGRRRRRLADQHAARNGARSPQRRAVAGGGTGGVSGPAVRAIALAQVHDVCGAVGIPVVAMGGVASGRDAWEMRRAGATLVAVGTESFRDPAAGARIAAELEPSGQTATIRCRARSGADVRRKR